MPYNLDFFNLIGTAEAVPFPNPMHGENSLRRPCRVKRCRGPFGFAQGRLFDSEGASLREVPAPLKMTCLDKVDEN